MPNTTLVTKHKVLILTDKDTFLVIIQNKKHTYYHYAVHENIQGQDIYYIRKPLNFFQ